MKRIKAVAISEYMNQKIAGMEEGPVGKVLSLHSGLFNIALFDGDLLTVHSSEHLRTPMSLEVSEFPMVSVELNMDVVRFTQPSRLVCGQCMIELDLVDVFSSQAVVLQEKADAALILLETHLTAKAKNRSVFHLLNSAAGCENSVQQIDSVEQHYGSLLRCSVKQLVSSVRGGHTDQAIEAALQLVGLGQGMTPAGDDFLQGFFLFAKASKQYGEIVQVVIEGIHQQSDLDTTRVSKALWRHLFAGRFGNAVVKLVEAYNRNEWELFAAQLEIIGRIGHSSGDDFLSGMYVAIAGLFDSGRDDMMGGEQQC